MSEQISDRETIREMRETCRSLALTMKMLGQRGYVISFNINANTGECDRFEVSRTVPYDLDKEIDS